MKIISIVLLALLAGCSTGGTASSPAADVYATKNAYAAALTVAVRYNDLPRCGLAASPPVCSDPAAVQTIRKANDATRATLDAAEDTVRAAPGSSAAATATLAAANALKAFQQITAMYAK